METIGILSVKDDKKVTEILSVKDDKKVTEISSYRTIRRLQKYRLTGR